MPPATAAYQWILGDVSINYHTLSDFRTAHGELLDRLLTESVAVLVAEGLVDLNRVAQDGMRVRASAGAASFRRRPTLEEAFAEAEAQVQALRAELGARPRGQQSPATEGPGPRRVRAGRADPGRRWIGCRSWRPRRSRRIARRPGARPPIRKRR